MGRLAAQALGVAIAAGFYLLLIDTASSPELYAGCGAVLLASAAWTAARRQRIAEARVRPAWLASSRRALAAVPVDIAMVTREAILQLLAPKQHRGRLRAVHFDCGEESSSLTIGKAALAEWAGSVAPNTIVLGVDDERGLLFVHQLGWRGGRETVDVIGLG